MSELERWAIHAIAAYAGQPLANVPPEPAAGMGNAVVEALHRLEAADMIVRVQYRHATWYELADGVTL